MRKTILTASILAGACATWLCEGTAHAQIPPIVDRDNNWATVSHVTTGIGAGVVTLMPRVYYSSPAATVGWKARWHFSALAPVMTFTTLSFLVEGPIKNAIKSPRPGCTVEQTLARLPDTGCETFGGPSTHAFVAWGATGYGLGVFLVDTLKYSDFNFNIGSFVGNVFVPLAGSIVTSVARSQVGGGTPDIGGHENAGQVLAGALPGVAVGAVLGVAYSFLQEPDCGYGNYLFCW